MGDFRREVEHGFADLSSRYVIDGYFTADCTSLGGLAALGQASDYHLCGGGRLTQIEFFANSPFGFGFGGVLLRVSATFGDCIVNRPRSGQLVHQVSVERLATPRRRDRSFCRERVGREEHIRIEGLSAEQA